MKIDLKYQPEPKQKEFHDLKSKFRLFIGAWRSGKTYSGCYEALFHCLAFPGNRGLIGRKDYSDMLTTTYETFKSILPTELIQSEVRSPVHILKLNNGSDVIFRGLKDDTGIGSLDLGWFFVDESEEIREAMFNRLGGRLSHLNAACLGWCASNPPNKDHWLYQRFNQDITGDYGEVHADTYQNRKYLPAGYIESLEKYPESWRKKYLHGEYGFTPDGTPFYTGFQEDRHKRQLSYIPSKVMYRNIDYGFRHPGCVWTQFDTKDRYMILAELMGTDITIAKFADRIIAFENQHFPDAKQYISYGDPAGKQVTDKTDQTSEQILLEKGIEVRSKYSEYPQRKELVEGLLSHDIEGMPELVVNESCPIIIDGFLGGYHYPEKIPGHETQHKDEIPYRDGYYEHLMNCMEYGVVNIFSIIKQRETSPYTPQNERYYRR